MNGRFLLDTNIVIALFAEDTSVQQHIAEAEAIFVATYCVRGTLLWRLKVGPCSS